MKRQMDANRNVNIKNLRNSSTKFEQNRVPISLPADSLVSYRDNDKIFGATDEENVAGLAFTIRKEGLNSPINVWKREDGSYVIYGGHRRTNAVLYNVKYHGGDNMIPCFVENYPKSEFERIRKFLDSNLESRGGIKGIAEDDSITCENISRIIREAFRMLECGKKELAEANEIRKKNGEPVVSFEDWFEEQFFNKELSADADMDVEHEDSMESEETETKGKFTMKEYVAKYLRVDNASFVQNYRNICDCPKEVIHSVENGSFPVSIASGMATLPQEKQLLIFNAWLRANELHKERKDGLDVTRDDMLKVVRMVKKDASITDVDVLVAVLFADTSLNTQRVVYPNSDVPRNEEVQDAPSSFEKENVDSDASFVNKETLCEDVSQEQADELTVDDVNASFDEAVSLEEDEIEEEEDVPSINIPALPKEKPEKKALTGEEYLQKFLRLTNSLEDFLSESVEVEIAFDKTQKRVYDEKMKYLENLIVNINKMR